MFLRSDDTDELTENDIETLKNYGVRTVIDLRSEEEVTAHPDKLANVSEITYHHVDVVKFFHLYADDNNYSADEWGSKIKHVKYTGEGNFKKQIFDIVANAEKGCTLFHCIAGKDRTGLISALILGLVGVNENDIIENYIVSWDLVKNRPKIMKTIEQDIKNGKIYIKRKRN